MRWRESSSRLTSQTISQRTLSPQQLAVRQVVTSRLLWPDFDPEEGYEWPGRSPEIEPMEHPEGP